MTTATVPLVSVNHTAALARLLRFLRVPGITGQEAAIATDLRSALLELGVPAQHIRHDTAHERIPLPTQTGNLWVHLPGTRKGPHRLFMTHMDTVPLCAGAQPTHKGRARRERSVRCPSSRPGRPQRPR
jgi:tripeptide aminopeptidase